MMGDIKRRRSALQHDQPPKHVIEGWAGEKLLFLISWLEFNTSIHTLMFGFKNCKTDDEVFLRAVDGENLDKTKELADRIYRALGEILICQNEELDKSTERHSPE